MKVGFTGTQKGMTDLQLLEFGKLITKLMPSEFHHGDCIGADTQAHKCFDGKKIIHPPFDTIKRAFNKGETRPIKPYLVRNKNIVNEITILIATPNSMCEELRSGTWSTIRYARKQNKKIYIIFPNGKIKIEQIESEEVQS